MNEGDVPCDVLDNLCPERRLDAHSKSSSSIQGPIGKPVVGSDVVSEKRRQVSEAKLWLSLALNIDTRSSDIDGSNVRSESSSRVGSLPSLSGAADGLCVIVEYG